MTEVRTTHTADLDTTTLHAIRALLRDAFDDLEEADVEHALGGMHATAWDGSQLVAHASVIQRRLLYQGTALRTGYMECVAVHPGRRRQGLGGVVMAEAERIIRGAYDIGALGATDEAVPFYQARGWQLWQGKSFVLTPDGVTPTEDDDGGIYVLPVRTELDLTATITCDWRDGDVW